MNSLDWIGETDWTAYLSDDLQLVKEVCGEAVVLALMQNFSGNRIFISSRPLRRAQEQFVLDHPEKTTLSLSLRLNVSEKFVQRVRKEKGGKNKN